MASGTAGSTGLGNRSSKAAPAVLWRVAATDVRHTQVAVTSIVTVRRLVAATRTAASAAVVTGPAALDDAGGRTVETVLRGGEVRAVETVVG